MPENWILQQARGASGDIALANPVLESGRIVLETDTGRTKIGDGSTAYNFLKYTGECRAWLSFDCVNSAATVHASFGIDAISNAGVNGKTTIHFSRAMPDSNYCMAGCVGAANPTTGLMVVNVEARTTTTATVAVKFTNGTDDGTLVAGQPTVTIAFFR